MDAIAYIFEFISAFKETILIVILLLFIGFEVVSKVTSKQLFVFWGGVNTISGVVLIASILVLGFSEGVGAQLVGVISVVISSFNLSAAFFTTKNMINKSDNTDNK